MGAFLSLFSGIGALDLGLERAGWACVGQVELDPWRRRVLEARFPDPWRHDDVRTLVPGEHEAGSVDLIAGGFPCQDLSVAGRRGGLAGARSGLFWELCRLAEALRPRWLLLENVDGLSAILEVSPDPRLSLSARAARGALRRSRARGRRLPEDVRLGLIATMMSGRP